MAEWNDETARRLEYPRFWNDAERHKDDVRAALDEIQRQALRIAELVVLVADEYSSRLRMTERAEKAEAENEALRKRITELEASMIRHFQDEHLAGDGPEIDRWKRENEALRADSLRLRRTEHERDALLGAETAWLAERDALRAEVMERNEAANHFRNERDEARAELNRFKLATAEIPRLREAALERDRLQTVVKELEDETILLTRGITAERAGRDRLRDALNKAGEWVAAVEPKLPMPGTGDSQQEVLDMIAAALAAQGSASDSVTPTTQHSGGKL